MVEKKKTKIKILNRIFEYAKKNVQKTAIKIQNVEEEKHNFYQLTRCLFQQIFVLFIQVTSQTNSNCNCAKNSVFILQFTLFIVRFISFITPHWVLLFSNYYSAHFMITLISFWNWTKVYIYSTELLIIYDQFGIHWIITAMTLNWFHSFGGGNYIREFSRRMKRKKPKNISAIGIMVSLKTVTALSW